MSSRLGQLAREDQCIQGHVTLDAAAVQQGHHLGQVGAVEVGGADAGVVPLEAEIDGVGAVLDGGDQAGPIAGRSEQLGLDMRPSLV